MKTKLLLFAVLILANKSYSQFSFGVSPGIGLNSAYFGYKVNNKFVTYIGFQYLNAKFKYEQSGEEFDSYSNQVISYSYTDEFSGSLYIPNIGIKYFIKQQNKIQTYLSLNISKPLISGEIKYDGKVDEDIKDGIENGSLWGGEFGFGMEYLFDENFSIGGEFGIRYIHLKYKDTFESSFYNPNTGNYEDSEITDDFRFNMSPTFTKISLNFYF